MDALRKQLGEHVRATREEQGHRSQPAFAEAANISARSVAAVELGQKVGQKVLRAIEVVLGWPRDSMTNFLTGGPLPAVSAQRSQRSDGVPHEWSAESRAAILSMTVEAIIEMGRQLRVTSGDRAAILWLREASRIKAEAAEIPSDENVR